jgi:hypothetical protein
LSNVDKSRRELKTFALIDSNLSKVSGERVNIERHPLATSISANANLEMRVQ